MNIKKLFIDWFTEPDNTTYCLIKFLTFIGAIVFFVATIIHVVQNKSFDYIAYGTGLAAVLTGAGAGLLMKKDSKSE